MQMSSRIEQINYFPSNQDPYYFSLLKNIPCSSHEDNITYFQVAYFQIAIINNDIHVNPPKGIS